MLQQFTVDLKNVSDELEVMIRFAKVLGIAGWSREESNPVWDAFSDDMRSLDTQSEIIRNNLEDDLIPKDQKITHVHLVIKNIQSVHANLGSKSYSTLCELLCEFTDPFQRDDLKFTFEIWGKDYENELDYSDVVAKYKEENEII